MLFGLLLILKTELVKTLKGLIAGAGNEHWLPLGRSHEYTQFSTALRPVLLQAYETFRTLAPNGRPK